MARRSITALAGVAALFAVLGGPHVVAHEGHDHKVLGTVTMAAADHVMLKDSVAAHPELNILAQDGLTRTERRP